MLFAKFITHFSRLFQILPGSPRRPKGFLAMTSCLLCHLPTEQADPICLGCYQELPILAQSCRICAQKLTVEGDVICGFCLQITPPFTQLYALFPYQSPITQLIIALKFSHQLKIARAFGLLIAKKMQLEWYLNRTWPDLIVPVPLHPQRLKERGFNQSLEIALPIARTLELPLDRFSLQRTRATAAQSSLSATKRIANVKGAFKVTRRLTGLHIALIDDVVTTGQTIEEACLVLKMAGAKQIDVWCCARA